MRTIGIPFCVAVALAGCGKREQASVLSPIVEQWQKGEKAGAISRFVDSDWTARPLFASGTVMSLNEDQFQKLPVTEVSAKMKEVLPEITTLRQIAQGVMEAGKEAAKQGDKAKARKHFTAVKQCGEALDSPETLKLVQLVGQAIGKMADAELAKVKP